MREFRKETGRTKRTQVWRIWRKNDVVFVEYGLLDGKMQQTPGEKFAAVNVGKKNEKAPSLVAQEELERQAEGQLKTGWYEVDPKTGQRISAEVSTEIRFDKVLPENLRFWKPNHDLTGHLKKLLESESPEVIWTRKRDGMQHTLVLDQGSHWKMYSSTMAPYHKDEPGIPWLMRYPKIEEALNGLELPKNTILVGELVTAFDQDDEGFDKDSLIYVSTIVKSKMEEAILKQENGGHLAFAIYDIIYWDGKPWYKDMEVSRRLGAIHELVRAAGCDHLTHVEMFLRNEVVHSGGRQEIEFDGTKAAAMGLAREKGWEGFVLLDPRGKFEDKGVNFAGKAQRPAFAAKVKPSLEADFVVFWDPDNGHGQWGKGKKAAGVGSVDAYLYDENGKLRFISKVGGGLSDKLVKEFANPKLYPAVWAVEFTRWTEHGSIQFPEFVRVRDDKKPEECTTEQMPAELAAAEEEEAA